MAHKYRWDGHNNQDDKYEYLINFVYGQMINHRSLKDPEGAHRSVCCRTALT